MLNNRFVLTTAVAAVMSLGLAACDGGGQSPQTSAQGDAASGTMDQTPSTGSSATATAAGSASPDSAAGAGGSAATQGDVAAFEDSGGGGDMATDQPMDTPSGSADQPAASSDGTNPQSGAPQPDS